MGYNRGDGVSIPLYYTNNINGELVSASKQQPYYTVKQDRNIRENFVLSDRFGNTEYYTTNNFNIAYITKAVDRNGNELDYTYDSDSFYFGNLLKVEDPASGRYISFSYDPIGMGCITSITDSAGRTVEYGYDCSLWGGGAALNKVTLPGTPDSPEGTSETYGYVVRTGVDLYSITDGNGNVIVSNIYDPQGGGKPDRVIEQTVNGHTATLLFDDSQKLISWTDYNGNVTDYYDDGNRNILAQRVHTKGLHPGVPSTTIYETDYVYGTGTGTDGPPPDTTLQPNNCYKTKETDPNGNGTSWTYDQYGNILTATKFSNPGGLLDGSKGTQVASSTTTYTYEQVHNKVASMTDSNGNKTTYAYDGNGNLLTITYPPTAAGTAQETFTYNSAGQVLTDTAPDGTVTQNTYDTTGGLTNGYLLQTVKDYSTGSGHLNATTKYAYDAYGNVASIQDPNLNTTNFIYNAQDQLVETDGASGEVEKRNYDGNGNLIVDQKQAPGGAWQKTVNIYNNYEQLTETDRYTDSTDKLATTYTYDNNGNRTTVTDPLGHTATTDDNNGTVTDPLGHTVTTAYDERNKPYLVTDELGNTTHYDFDPNGNTTTLTDELGHVTTYAFDGLDRLEQKTFPDGSYQTWTYDATGNITGLLTTAGNTIAQTYDTRNRMLTQSYAASTGPSTITNVYDIVGRVLTTTEGGASLTYGYDNLGRTTSFTDQAGRTSTYAYDLDGHRTSTTYPTAITVQRGYDASSRLTTLKDGGNNTMATYSYDILDRVTGVTLANGTSVIYGYDLVNRLSYVNNALGSGNRNYSYVYDNASRVVQTTEPRGTITSGYTNRNEVNSIAEPTGSPFADQAFTYDAGFNRSSWSLGSSIPGLGVAEGLTTYAVNNLNQYSTVSGQTAPTWNTDGGLHTFAGNTYVYDALQRLTEVDYSGGKTLFSYDPLGRRVKKVDANASGQPLSTFSYHYDGSEVAVEYQPSTTWTYYLGLGLDQVVMRDSGSAKQWYYRDGHGSTSAVADNSGNVLEQYEYNAQGQFHIFNASGTDITSSGTAIANDLLYTGRNYDYETGNYFYRARYYNPELGRFISRDPLSGAEFSQGTNLYAYCRNNFLNASDPTGMWEVTITVGWGYAGQVNFGVNDGNFNLGVAAGLGEGADVSYSGATSEQPTSLGVTGSVEEGVGKAESLGGEVEAKSALTSDGVQGIYGASVTGSVSTIGGPVKGVDDQVSGTLGYESNAATGVVTPITDFSTSANVGEGAFAGAKLNINFGGHKEPPPPKKTCSKS